MDSSLISSMEYFMIKVLYLPHTYIQTLLVIIIDEFVPDAIITFH